ncbi:MAG: nucleoside phosphorylase [Bacteroidota bacterium]
MQPIPPSELILNPDGSIYHLALRPEQLANTILLAGDPGRVAKISRHFDRIECSVQHREFVTHTGWLGGKRLSAISTGIGTDNIDIVLNELDALVNIDFQTRTVKKNLTSLDLIRLGTSGSLSAEIPVDSLVSSAFGAGLDNLLSYYFFQPSEKEARLQTAFASFTETLGLSLQPFVAQANEGLVAQAGQGMFKGITLTCPGFFAPQGRTLRAASIIGQAFFEKVGTFRFEEFGVTNFEMETAAIFGLAKLLGHRAASCNAIIANRISREFSAAPDATVDKLILHVLQRL